jgi:Na+/proline symporter
MEFLIGYGIIGLYLVLLLLLGRQVSRRFPKNNSIVHEYLFSGKKVPFGLLAPSIFTSWLWVTSIVGSGEAGFRFGISGGLSYSLGAGLAFAVFVPILIKIKRMMPEGMTVVDFVGERFTPFLKDVYYIFAILVIVYVIVEQSAGIALVFNGLFHVSFKKVAFITVILCGCYVVWRGMRGVLYNELVNFFLISAGILVFAYVILRRFDIDTLYLGLNSVASDPANSNYNPQAMNLLSKSGMMYAFSAILIGLGQILVDPAYYVKAYIAKDEKTIIRSFLAGGVIFWMPAAIISSFVLGYVTLSQNIDLSKAVNLSIEISTNVLTNNFGMEIKMLFAAVIFCIGCTSIIHCLIGVQSLFTLDFYKNKINSLATDEDKMKFGKVVTLLIALLCALISISLEKVSLLTIDTFSGIFFAAPCGVILVGIISRKVIGNMAWLSIVMGIIAGFGVWISISDQELNYFLGIAFSFFVPLLFLSLVSLLSRNRYNLKKLLFFKQ